MKDVILDTIIDSLKLLPFLLIAFLIIEFIEHKLSTKNKIIITKSKKFGPIIGSIFGIIPQCGFSVLATNLYISRIITLGTLIAIYLSTSDEMLPILLSEKVNISIVLEILLIKILFGMVYGIIIDLIFKNKITNTQNYDICSNEHCHCENKNIIIPAIKHTINIFFFLLVITFLINIVFHYFGENYLSTILLKNSIFSPLISSLIGLIPNCGSSVLLTKLYTQNIIAMPELISGLLTNCGTATIVLFKSNKYLKENIKIIAIIYLLGAISGIILKLF